MYRPLGEPNRGSHSAAKPRPQGPKEREREREREPARPAPPACPPGAVLFTSRHVAGRASRVTLAGQERYSLAVLCRCSATVTGAASLTVTSNRPPTFGNIYIFLYTFLVSVFFQCLGGWVFQFGSLNTIEKKKRKTQEKKAEKPN